LTQAAELGAGDKQVAFYAPMLAVIINFVPSLDKF
jgi:hypothetical protein